jgi:hypothetical protein
MKTSTIIKFVISTILIMVSLWEVYKKSEKYELERERERILKIYG